MDFAREEVRKLGREDAPYSGRQVRPPHLLSSSPPHLLSSSLLQCLPIRYAFTFCSKLWVLMYCAPFGRSAAFFPRIHTDKDPSPSIVYFVSSSRIHP